MCIVTPADAFNARQVIFLTSISQVRWLWTKKLLPWKNYLHMTENDILYLYNT